MDAKYDRNAHRSSLAILRSARNSSGVVSNDVGWQKLVIKADRSRVKSGEILYTTGTGFIPAAQSSSFDSADKTEYHSRSRLRANTAGERYKIPIQ